MDAAEYQSNLRNAYLWVSVVADLPLPDMIDAINRAETVGPILDPTAFIKNGQKMREDKDVLAALLPVWRVGQKLKQAAKPAN